MSKLTPERLVELRRIAEAATPGPLTVHLCDDARYAAFVDAPNLGPDAPELAVFLIERDARFFADFDRDTVLAMIAEIERLRRERDDLQAEFEAQNSMLGKVIIENGDLQRERDTLADAFAELVRIYESEQEADEYGNVPRPEWVQRAMVLVDAIGVAQEALGGDTDGQASD